MRAKADRSVGASHRRVRRDFSAAAKAQLPIEETSKGDADLPGDAGSTASGAQHPRSIFNFARVDTEASCQPSHCRSCQFRRILTSAKQARTPIQLASRNGCEEEIEEQTPLPGLYEAGALRRRSSWHDLAGQGCHRTNDGHDACRPAPPSSRSVYHRLPFLAQITSIQAVRLRASTISSASPPSEFE